MFRELAGSVESARGDTRGGGANAGGRGDAKHDAAIRAAFEFAKLGTALADKAPTATAVVLIGFDPVRGVTVVYGRRVSRHQAMAACRDALEKLREAPDVNDDDDVDDD